MGKRQKIFTVVTFFGIVISVGLYQWHFKNYFESTSTVTLKVNELQSLTANLAQLLQQATIEPVHSSDRKTVEGFRLTYLEPGSIYEKLGLLNGDVVVGVNQHPVDSPQRAMELYNALKTSGDFQINIKRNGAPTTLRFKIE